METTNTPKNNDATTLLNKACAEVQGFEQMYRRLERRMHTQRRSESIKLNYARHLAQLRCISSACQQYWPTIKLKITWKD